MTRIIGKHYEELALNYLHKQNLILLHKNFHSRYGEIDLIMQENNTFILFIEVKYRKTGIDDALFSITNAKKNKIIKCANYYLMLKNSLDYSCRFDMIAIDAQEKILWLHNIFI